METYTLEVVMAVTTASIAALAFGYYWYNKGVDMAAKEPVVLAKGDSVYYGSMVCEVLAKLKGNKYDLRSLDYTKTLIRNVERSQIKTIES